MFKTIQALKNVLSVINVAVKIMQWLHVYENMEQISSAFSFNIIIF